LRPIGRSAILWRGNTVRFDHRRPNAGNPLHADNPSPARASNPKERHWESARH